MSECGQESSLKTRAEQENKQKGNLSGMHEKKSGRFAEEEHVQVGSKSFQQHFYEMKVHFS